MDISKLKKRVKKIEKEQKLQKTIMDSLDKRIFDNTLSEFSLKRIEGDLIKLKSSGAVSIACICVLGALVTYLLIKG